MPKKSNFNIGLILTSVGTLATLVFGFFSIFIAPKYINDAYKQKQISANQEIVSDLQELFYSNEKVDPRALNTLVKGKELKFDIEFPIFQEEILVEVQESFINSKFLQLAERKKLFDKIDSLKIQASKEIKTETKKQSKSKFEIVVLYILGSISLIISLLLFIGSLNKRKKQINEEFQKKYEEIEEARPDSLLSYANFEKRVSKILHRLELNFEDSTKRPNESFFDFVINYNNKRIAVEVKSRITPNIIIKLKEQFDKSDVNALIIISNRVIEDFSTFSLLSEIKKSLPRRPIYFISSFNDEEIKLELRKILDIEI